MRRLSADTNARTRRERICRLLVAFPPMFDPDWTDNEVRVVYGRVIHIFFMYDSNLIAFFSPIASFECEHVIFH